MGNKKRLIDRILRKREEEGLQPSSEMEPLTVQKEQSAPVEIENPEIKKASKDKHTNEEDFPILLDEIDEIDAPIETVEKKNLEEMVKIRKKKKRGALGAPLGKTYKKRGVIIRDDIYQALDSLRKENGTTLKEELNKAILRGLKGIKIRKLTEEDRVDPEERIDREGDLDWVD